MISSQPMMTAAFVLCLICTSLFSSNVLLPYPAAAQALSFDQLETSEAKNLEAYLARHRLDSLLIEHLETRLERTLDAAERKTLAIRLATLYGQKLTSLSGASDKVERWQSKADRLIELFPDLDSDDLRIAGLHARYLILESQFQDAWKQGAERDSLLKLVEPWQALSTDLQAAAEVLRAKSESLFALQQADSANASAISRQISAVESKMLHCHYLNGWTSYFRAATAKNEAPRWLGQAEAEFRKFLQINETQLLNELDARWFDFSSAWITRAVVGLASTSHARQALKPSEHLFSLIESQTLDPESSELVPFWKLNNLCFFKQFDQAVALSDMVATRTDVADHAMTKFWLAAFESAQIAKEDNPRLGDIMMKRSLAGLTRQMRGGILIGLADTNPAAFEFDGQQFNDLWVKGYLEFYRSQQQNDRELLESARLLLKRAVQIEPEAAFKDDWARCAYLLAWIHLRQDNLELAAREFQRIADLLENRDRKLAAESQWLAVESLVKISQRDSRKTNEAFSAIERMLKRFPDSKIAKRAEFEKVRLEVRSVPAQQAIDRLQQFRQGNPSFAQAQSEIVGLRYRKWAEAKSAGAAATQSAFQELKLAQETLGSDPAVPAELKLKASLRLADIYLRTNPVDLLELEKVIASADELANRISSQSNVFVEYRYYQMLIAQKTGQAEEANIRANWLVQFATGTKFETSALIHLAQQFDQTSVQQFDGDTASLDRAVQIYERLTEKLGRSEEKLRQSANSRVALARLAEFKQFSGEPQEANRIFDLLLSCFPNNAKYLRQSATAKEAVGDWGNANRIWSRLSKGVEAGSDLWFEAKSHLVTGLSKTDPDAARSLLQQTIQLSGEIPEAWKERLEAIRLQLEQQ